MRTPTGEFVVVWTSVAGASSRLLARAFDAGVQPRSQEISLAEDVGPGSVGLDADGNLVVTYRAAGARIVGARFDAGGAAVGEPVIVTTAGGDEPRPAVATMPTGEFVVVWRDQTYITPEPGSGGSYSRSSSVYVAPFDARAGALPQQSAWYRGNENFRPRAAAGGRDFVVVWSSCYSEPGENQAPGSARHDRTRSPG